MADCGIVAAAGFLATLGARSAGVSWVELETLSALAQRGWGWSTPVSFSILIALASLAVYGVAHLGVALRAESRLRLALVATCATGGAALAAAAHQELLRVGAVLGAERMTKASALASLVVLAAASAAGIWGRGPRRSHLLAWGLLATGLGAGVFGRWYLDPPIEGLRDVNLGGRRDGWATVAGYPIGRDDLVATFGIPPDADQVELGGLTPRIAGDFRCSPFAAWSPGLLYWLEPDLPEVKQVLRDGMGGLRPPGEIWRRGRGRWSAPSRSGFRFPPGVSSWSVSPAGDLAAAVFATGQTRRTPFAPVERRFSLAVLDRRLFGERWRVVAEGLFDPPQILQVTQKSLHVGVLLGEYHLRKLGLGPGATFSMTQLSEPPSAAVSASSAAHSCSTGQRYYLAAATFLLRAKRWEPGVIAQVWQGSQARPVALSGDRLLTPCASPNGQAYHWCVLDARSLAFRFGVGPNFNQVRVSSPLPLAGGGVAVLARWGDVGWSLSVSDRVGKPLPALALPEARQARLAAEVGEGWIAFAWRTDNPPHRLRPSLGWRLEAYDPETGTRRLLAKDIAAGAGCTAEVPCRVFLDSEGHLVVPTLEGVKRLAQVEPPA